MIRFDLVWLEPETTLFFSNFASFHWNFGVCWQHFNMKRCIISRCFPTA